MPKTSTSTFSLATPASRPTSPTCQRGRPHRPQQRKSSTCRLQEPRTSHDGASASQCSSPTKKSAHRLPRAVTPSSPPVSTLTRPQSPSSPRHAPRLTSTSPRRPATPSPRTSRNPPRHPHGACAERIFLKQYHRAGSDIERSTEHPQMVAIPA